jgi:hypothetical protein
MPPASQRIQWCRFRTPVTLRRPAGPRGPSAGQGSAGESRRGIAPGIRPTCPSGLGRARDGQQNRDLLIAPRGAVGTGRATGGATSQCGGALVAVGDCRTQTVTGALVRLVADGRRESPFTRRAASLPLSPADRQRSCSVDRRLDGPDQPDRASGCDRLAYGRPRTSPAPIARRGTRQSRPAPKSVAAALAVSGLSSPRSRPR